MAHIIIIEDNLSYAEDVADYLTEVGHEVRVAGDAATMWRMLGERAADVILLDLGLPDDSGFNIIPRMRELYPDVGVLVLTARVMLDSRVMGLQLGADNYLTKPIKFPELAAHIEALCRRVLRHGKTPRAKEWVLRTADRQLEILGVKAIDLTEKEFKFLHMLATSTRPLPRDTLLIGMGSVEEEGAKKLDMLVYRLRKKIKAAAGEELPVRSAYGEGYSMTTALSLA